MSSRGDRPDPRTTSLLDRSGGKWQKLRLRVLQLHGHACVDCGATDRLEIDHIIPRAMGGGDEIENLAPRCVPCHRAKSARDRRAARNRKAEAAAAAATPGSMQEVRNPSPDPLQFSHRESPQRRLTGREAPGEPRYFPGPHPDRVGSLGAEVMAYGSERFGIEWLDWQARVLDRALEVNERDRFCWPRSIILVPRRAGKSTIGRSICEYMALHGREVLSASAKLSTVMEFMRPSLQYYRDDKAYHVKHAKDQPEIHWPGGKGRWISQAANDQLARGFDVEFALLDEIQDVPVEAWEAMAPAMAQIPNPLVMCFGTAARGPSELLNRLRDAGLRGDGILHIEWSAPSDLDYLDEETWRLAQPRWTPEWLSFLRQEVKVHAEPYIRSEYLCQPIVGGTEPWLNLADWERARRPLVVPDRPAVVAVEESRGGGGATVAAAWHEDDSICVTAWPVTDLDEAWRWAGQADRAICGVTLRNEQRARDLRAAPVGRRETATAIPELRRLLPDRLRWDGDRLDEQVRALELAENTQNSITIAPRSPSDLVRTAAWAVQALQAPTPEPTLI